MAFLPSIPLLPSFSHHHHHLTTRTSPSSHLAIVSTVPDSLPSGLLSPGISPKSLNISRARQQHTNYISLLSSADAITSIHQLSPQHHLPDSVFVEDPILCLSSTLAIVGKSGHPSRAMEKLPLISLFQSLGIQTLNISPRLDGGDCIKANGFLFIGISTRTEFAAIQAVQQVASNLWNVHPITVQDDLHLKSLVTWVGGTKKGSDGFLVAVENHAGLMAVKEIEKVTTMDWDVVWVPEYEKLGANVLFIPPPKNGIGSGLIIVQEKCKETVKKISEKIEMSFGELNNKCVVKTIDMTELAKANGALTCCSVLVE